MLNVYIPVHVFIGVSKLVSAMVRTEVDGLLRGVYSSAASQRRPGTHARHRSVASIPQAIRSAYDACHTPALRPTLACMYSLHAFSSHSLSHQSHNGCGCCR